MLGDKIKKRDDIYTSINADGGTANNEPVELCRELMYEMRQDYYGDILKDDDPERKEKDKDQHTITRREQVLKELTNSTVVLIDPFPSIHGKVDTPIIDQGRKNSENILNYAGSLINAMRSTLLIDAKLTMEAYSSNNYGLYLVAPSHSARKPENAIACGALGGFAGFLAKEFRIHDYYLGRHNAQSFLRKYFVVDADLKEKKDDGQPNADHACVKAVLAGYSNEEVKRRFLFKDPKRPGKSWIPIIPDVTLPGPFDPEHPQNPLPEYKLTPLTADYIDQYEDGIKGRIKAIIDNVIAGNGAVKLIAKMFQAGKLTDKLMQTMKDDLRKRGFMY